MMKQLILGTPKMKIYVFAFAFLALMLLLINCSAFATSFLGDARDTYNGESVLRAGKEVEIKWGYTKGKTNKFSVTLNSKTLYSSTSNSGTTKITLSDSSFGTLRASMFVTFSDGSYERYADEIEVIAPWVHNPTSEPVQWQFDGVDTIVFSGNGRMTSYSDYKTPWSCCSLKAKNVIIETGVTSVGNNAFKFFSFLETVDLPSTLTSIGEDAFAFCDFKSISIPSNVNTIGAGAFQWCTELEAIDLPESLTTIGKNAFNHCSSLRDIELSSNVKTIGYCAFYECSELTKVSLQGISTNIENQAFLHDDRLTEIDILACNSEAERWFLNNGYSDILHVTPHVLTKIDRIEPTCTNTGCEEYWICNVCEKLFADGNGSHIISAPVIIPAKGHTWKASEYTWSNDKLSVTAKRICENDSTHVNVETALTSYEIVMPTEEEPGKAQYLCRFQNREFANQSKTIIIPPLGSMAVLQLPSALRTIRTESFSNLAFQAVIIPEGCTAIEEYAFSGCTDLLYVRIPASVQSYPDNAFSNCSERLVVYREY